MADQKIVSYTDKILDEIHTLIGTLDGVVDEMHVAIETLVEQGARFNFDYETGLIGIDFPHHKIHDGESYCLTDVVDLAINNVRDIQITTPEGTNWAHFFFRLSTESETEWFLYEDVVIVTPGTAIDLFNSDRNSENESDLVVKFIDNVSVANANADTTVAAATEIYHGISGAGKDAGMHDHEHEIILKQNEDYCIRLIANAAGYVDYHLDWYEHVSP